MNYKDIVNHVAEVIGSYNIPITLRQIYYRLVAAGHIPNTRSSYNGLSKHLVRARENQDIDESRIVDRSRGILDYSFDSPEACSEYFAGLLRSTYVMRFWESQKSYVEIWVEKDALSQVIATVAHPFNTVIAPSRGYSSYSYVKRLLDRSSRFPGKNIVILHFADHDPSGLDMSRDLSERCKRYVGDVTVKRIALNHIQVMHYRLIPNPVKMADARAVSYRARFGSECWELDALEPSTLVSLCEQALDAEIDNSVAWKKIRRKEKRARELIQKTIVKAFEESKP